ncbi:hypothetical protein [Notoacmeibacter ruber]|uniref:DUF4893 domain-containing protein n=1 Tax=Notoacmeibacter ruber TaxID=2670375 RepID=A0A3L7JEF7_9HYPH|nr:hypothetical protein [Notoacmeibacter ruber]RLQ88699.1 hypothetical protein D8780_11225 [Notoacmeibacter ruber]
MRFHSSLFTCAAALFVSLAPPAFALDEIGEQMIDRPPDNYIAVREAEEKERDRLEQAGLRPDEDVALNAYSAKEKPRNEAGARLKAMEAAGSSSDAKQADVNLFDGLVGNWAGEGDTYIDRIGRELSVSCDFSIGEAKAEFVLDGECGALFLDRAIGIELKPQDDGEVDGNYMALKEGPTRLEGRLTAPDTLVLTMHWPKVVMGDRVAKMELKRLGADSFRQIVLDMKDGEETVTSDITFQRKS